MRELKKTMSVLLVSSIFISNTQNLLVYADGAIDKNNIEKPIKTEHLTSPELRKIYVDKKVVKPGDKVTVTMDIVGLESLKKGEYIVVEWGGENSHQMPIPEVIYNESINKYQYTVDIDGAMVNGKHEIFEVFIRNEYGDEVKLSNDKVDLSDADFEVIEGINACEEIIKAVTIDKKEVQLGQNINISVELANNSYIDTIEIDYKNEEDIKNIELKYNKASNKYEGKVIIDENTKLGIWKPEYIKLKSENGKCLTILYDSFGEIDDDFNFEVINQKEEDKPIEENPEDNIIENSHQIEGVEFVQGNASIDSPLSIKVNTLEGLNELLDLTITSNFNVDIVNQLNEDNDFLVYLLELTKNSNSRAQESYFIEIKVAKNNQEVINKLESLVELDNINNETNNDSVLDEVSNNNSSNNNNLIDNNESNNNIENNSSESNNDESPKTYDGGVSSYILTGIGSIGLLSILKKRSITKK